MKLTGNELTVKRLKELLDEVPDDLIVILAKDAEGNYFSPVPNSENSSQGRYEPDSTYSGDFFTYEDIGSKKINAFCLWPTN